MPGFSANPQPKNSGEKSERPKRGELNDDTIEGVPEGVKESKRKGEKTDIEKLKSQESYEEVYEVEIDGETYEIPVQVSYFEYPERIQEDTGGVLGYERKQINWEWVVDNTPVDLGRDIEEIKKEMFQLNQHKDSLKKSLRKELSKLKQNPEEVRSDKINDLRNELKNIHYEVEDIQDESRQKLWNFVSQITDGEFPRGTANHEMGVMGVSLLTDTNPKEGFGAQKVFNPRTLIKVLEEGVDPVPPLTNDLHFRKIESNKKFEHEGQGEDRVFKKLDAFEKAMQDRTIYAIARGGISTSEPDFGSTGFYKDNLPNPHSTVYGFGGKNEAFVDYLESAKEVLEDIDTEAFSRQRRAQVKSSDRFISGEKPRTYLRGDKRNHPYIPVINGHPNVPDLRWCHAEYGYIPTEKNLNVVRFISEDIEEENGTEASEGNDS